MTTPQGPYQQNPPYRPPSGPPPQQYPPPPDPGSQPTQQFRQQSPPQQYSQPTQQFQQARPQQYAPPPQQYAPPQHYAPPPQQYGPPHQYSPAPQYSQAPAQQQPPQYGQQPYGQPSEGIAVTTQFFPLAWVFFFVKPKIFVDGHEAPPAPWGRTVVAAGPGQHHVHVFTPYFLPPRLGPADAVVDVPSGQVVELEYKAPLWSFSPGSLGQGPQKYNGVAITIAIAAVPLAFFLLLFLFALLAAI